MCQIIDNIFFFYNMRLMKWLFFIIFVLVIVFLFGSNNIAHKNGGISSQAINSKNIQSEEHLESDILDTIQKIKRK